MILTKTQLSMLWILTIIICMVISDFLTNLRKTYYFKHFKQNTQSYTIKYTLHKSFETRLNYKELFRIRKFKKLIVTGMAFPLF